MNHLYYGDNLDVLRRYVSDESVDLVYLDPPFKSDANYNVLFAEQDGSRSAAQIQAFEDTWRWDQAAAAAFQDVVESGGQVSLVMQAFRKALGENDMLAYLAMMAPRLVELRRVLRDTGSLYLHCDPAASHYLKILLDAIFGPQHFRNEIIWRRYKRPKGSQHKARRFGASTDTILFYTKSDEYPFFLDRVKVPLDEAGQDKRYTHHDDKGPYYSGPLLRSASMGARPNLVYEYKGFTPGSSGWRMTKNKLVALDEQGDMFWTAAGIPRRKVRAGDNPGIPVDNLWIDIEAIGSQAQERLGYPTQKPLALLERIILASSDAGSTVLDAFCGCGTTIDAAQKLGRNWIGIDITNLAISLIKHRLRNSYGDGVKYDITGEPVSVDDAKQLAHDDPYQFQWWALGLVGARPVEQKKGADKGIDGRLYFHDEDGSRQTKQVIFSVKAGHTSVAHVRDLRGVLDREKAHIGVLISMEEPTKPMRTEAASAGFYRSPWTNKDYPRMQLLTVEELLAGKQVDMPAVKQTSTTFKKAPKAKAKKTHRQKLLGDE